MRQYRKPSPALVISCIALAVSLSGAGYAAVALPKNSVGTKQLKKNAVISSKVKNGSLLRADFKAGQLPKGDQGEPGAPGTALAYAHVSLFGTFVLGEDKNFSAVGREATGYFCLRVPFVPKNIVATLEGSLSTGGEILVTRASNINCSLAGTPGPFNITVETRDSAGVLVNKSFYISVN